MSTENIDVVINPGTGGRRVVRDLNDIANAANSAQNRIDQMQRALNGLGRNSGLSQFQSQLTAVNTQLSAMNAQLNQMNGGMNRLGSGGGSLAGIGALKTAIGGLMGLLSVQKIMDWADAWISATGKIRTLAATQADATAVMARLFEIAQNVRAPVEKLAQLYHFMTISAQDLGASQNQMLRVTETIGKVLAVQGTGFSASRGALLQLAQTFGTARVRAQEFNSMMQGTPLILKIVANHIDGAHGSVSALRQIMLAGKLSSKDFFDALEKGAADADAMFANAPKTFGQAFTVLKNAIIQYVGQVNEASSVSTAFYTIMQTVAQNLPTIAGSFAIVGAVLIALPFGPVAVAIAAVVTAIVLLGDKMQLAGGYLTSLKDVGAVVFEDLNAFIGATQTKLQEFAFTNIPDLAKSFQALGNVTFKDVALAGARMWDSLVGGAAGAQQAMIAAFAGLPVVMDQIGKQMFNAIVGHIQNIINTTIDGINRIAKFVGQDLVAHVNIERAKVDDAAFKSYGAQVGAAFNAGVQTYGKPLENYIAGVFDRATGKGIDRILKGASNTVADLNRKTTPITPPVKPDMKGLREDARNELAALQQMFDTYKQRAAELTELERHKEVMLKAGYDSGLMNFREYTSQLEKMQDDSYQSQKQLIEVTMPQLQAEEERVLAAMRARGAKPLELDNQREQYVRNIQQMTDALDKLNNKQEETLAQRTAAKVKPLNDSSDQMQKQIALDDLNYQQELQKIEAKKNINELDERNLFIQQELLRLTGPYEDALQKVISQLQQAREQGLFESDNPAVVASLNRMSNMADSIRGKINDIKETAPQALAEAFDAGKVNAFAKELNHGLAEALVNAGKDGGAGLRKFLQEELLKKPFVMVLEAVLKPFTQAIAGIVMSGVNALIGGLAPALSGIMGGGQGGAGGGLGSLSNVGSIVNTGSNIVSAFSAGYSGLATSGAGVGLAAEGGGATLIGSSGLMAAEGGGLGAGVSAAMGAIPVAGWVALAGVALYSLFGGQGGGPKIGDYVGAGTVNPTGEGLGAVNNHTPELTKQLSDTVRGLNTQYNNLARALGGRTGATFGIGVSTDPEGNSPSFAEVTALNGAGQGVYSQQDFNVGRSQEALAARLSQLSTDAMIAALRNSGADQAYLNYFDRISAGLDAEGKQAAFQTLMDIAQLTQAFKLLGSAGVNLTSISVEAKAKMLELAGSVNDLASGMGAYASNFFSADEKKRASAANINSALAAGGVTGFDALNGTREQFRAIVESLDLNSDTGQHAFVALMSVAGAFADITQAADGAAASTDRLSSMRTQLNTAYQKERGELQNTIAAIEQWRDRMVSFRSSLKQGSNSPLTPLEKYNSASADYASVVTAMKSSDATVRAGGQARFESVAGQFLDASKIYNASSTQYQTDFAKVLADSQSSQDLGDQQYQTSLDQLQKLDDSVKNLIDINTSVLSVRDAIVQLNGIIGASINPQGSVSQLYNEVLGRAPDQGGLDYWSNSLKNGGTVDSVRAGLLGSQEYLGSQGPSAGITQLYQSLLGRAPDQGGLQYWMQQFQGGMSMTDITNSMKNSGEYKGLPGHAAGMGFVPRNDYLFRAHYGEAILNQSQADMWRGSSGGVNMDPVTEGLAAVHKELTTMRGQQEAAVRAEIASNEQALERNAQQVGRKVADSADRQSFRDRARSKHRIA